MKIIGEFNKKKKTGVIIFPNEGIVRKFTLFKKNYKLIKNHIYGQEWYAKRLKNKGYLNKNLIIKKNLNYIDSILNIGFQKNFWDSFEKNYFYLKTIIQHYKFIWPKNRLVFFHGDLTIGNVIFINKKKPLLIDWENSKQKKLWGLDICYLLLSSLILPKLEKKNDSLNSKEKILFKKIWNNFFLNDNYEYLKDPFNYFIKQRLFDKNHYFYKISKRLKKNILNLIH